MTKSTALSVLLASSAALLLSACGGAQSNSREQIRAVGSSTVYPFAKIVADSLAKSNSTFKSPIIESTGTGAGMKLFCGGVGVQHPDIATASRRMKKSEFEDCAKNGVDKIVEVQVGLDGIAFAEAKGGLALKLTQEDVYKALAANPYGKPNTTKTWKDVNPSLPAEPILVYGPPSTSGTRDALKELVLMKGCDANPEMKALKDSDKDKHEQICTEVRNDGAYVDAGENDNLIVQKLVANPNALGIFGFSFLEENLDKIQGETINGVAPTFETIADGKYPVSRPLFVYVKKAHVGVIPGIKEFIAEFTSEKAVGDDGYLSKKGLIPLPDAKRKQVAADANSLKTLAP